MRIVIHVGMHKTGTSSIQETYFRFTDPSFEYVTWDNANHSVQFVLMFEEEDKLKDYYLFKGRGEAFEQTLPGWRAEWRDKVSHQLNEAGTKTLVYSAEDISSPVFEDATQNMADFFETWTHDIQVIGYARGPQSFIASAFQQHLQMGVIVADVVPQYRYRFEKFDRIFGRDRVLLKEFARSALVDGDAITDFAQAVGIAVPPEDQIVRSNESLTLNATALLYVQRKFGQGFVKGFDQAHVANARFISELADIGEGKLKFSTTMLADTLDEISDDISWMEERLGHSFSESGAANDGGIDSLDELVDIALSSYDALLAKLGATAQRYGPANMENLIRALEALRVKCYEEIAPGAGHGAAGQSGPAGGRDADDAAETRRKLANILWSVENLETMPANADDRRQAFQAVKAQYLQKASQIIRRLPNHSLDIVDTSDDK